MHNNTRNVQKENRVKSNLGHVDFEQVVKHCSHCSSHVDEKCQSLTAYLAEYMLTIGVVNRASLTKSASACSFNFSVNATANLHVRGRKTERVDMLTCKIT